MRRFSYMKNISNPTIATIDSELFCSYVGPVQNEVIRFDKIHKQPEPHYVWGMCFPNVHTVYITDCHADFPCYEIHRRRFPKVKQILFMSRFEVQDLTRFPNAWFTLSEEHAKLSYADPARFVKKLDILPQSTMYRMLDYYTDTFPEIWETDRKISDSIISSIDMNARQRMANIVSRND